MFCGKCGAKNPDGAAFCGNCGAPLSQTAPEQRNAAPVQPPAAPPPAANTARPSKRIGAVPVVVAVIVLFLIVRGSSGKETPPADDSPAPSVQDPVVPDGGGSQGGGTTGTTDGEGTGTGGESGSTPSGLTGTPDESGVITVQLTDMGEYDAVVLSENDWDVLADLKKSVTCVSNGRTYYLGADRLTPLDLDAERNLIMQIPTHWIHIDGLRPYLNYVGDYTEPEGEYVVYAQVNGSDAFLSVITDWSSYISIRGYYLGDLSSGAYEGALYEFSKDDQIVLILMTSEGMLGTAPYAPGDLSIEYKAVNTANLSEISVQYTMTDINGQRYCTPYMTWK